jgi:hypothetical protein
MHTRVRAANLLMLISALLLLLGGTALVLASGPQGWSDLTSASVYMVRGHGAFLAVLFLFAVGVAAPLIVLALRSAAAARRLGAAPPAAARRIAPDDEKLVGRARRRLDLEICRARPDVDRVVDVLLGAPGDLEARALHLKPAGMLVEISLEVGERRHAITSLPPPLYSQVLDRLRAMIGSGETGDGVVELRSSTRSEPVLVRLKRGERGVEAKLQVVSRDEDEGPIRRRRSSSVVFRMERPTPISDVITGEFQVPPFEEHDGTDPGSGLLIGFGRPGGRDAKPPPREIGVAESWLRLVMGLLLIGLVVGTFWHAFGWGLQSIGGHCRAPWRNVSIHLVSSPTGGEVSVAGTVRGQTPLTLVEPCRGRPILVLVRARGYSTWQWTGICPTSGRLELDAELQRRAGATR